MKRDSVFGTAMLWMAAAVLLVPIGARFAGAADLAGAGDVASAPDVAGVADDGNIVLAKAERRRRHLKRLVVKQVSETGIWEDPKSGQLFTRYKRGRIPFKGALLRETIE